MKERPDVHVFRPAKCSQRSHRKIAEEPDRLQTKRHIPSRQRFANDSETISTAPTTMPRIMRHRRPQSSMNTGIAISVTLYIAQANIKPAKNSRLRARQYTNTAIRKKPTTEICPPIQVSSVNAIDREPEQKSRFIWSAVSSAARSKSSNPAAYQAE